MGMSKHSKRVESLSDIDEFVSETLTSSQVSAAERAKIEVKTAMVLGSKGRDVVSLGLTVGALNNTLSSIYEKFAKPLVLDSAKTTTFGRKPGSGS